MDIRKAESPRERIRPSPILSEKIPKSQKSDTTEAPSNIKKKTLRPSSPSPINNAVNRPQSPFTVKRSQSAERRRPETPSRTTPSKSRTPTVSSPSYRNSTPVRDVSEDLGSASRRRPSSRTPDGLWPSMRSLSASFQGESIAKSLKNGDKLLLTSSSGSNSTQIPKLERKIDSSKGKDIRDHSENSKPSENRSPISLNLKNSLNSSSMCMDLNDKSNRMIPSPVISRGISPTRRGNITNGVHRVPPKIGDELLKHMREVPVKSLERENPMSGPRRTLSLSSLPNKIPFPSSFLRPSSPSSTIRRSPSSENPKSQPGVSSSLIFMGNASKGKKSANQMEVAHQLRLLHNRHLQWRFINARADVSTSMQRITSESILQTVWVSISEMWHSNIENKIIIDQWRREMKLGLILGEQISHLEHWEFWDSQHSNSLSGFSKSLKSGILRLPLTSGAKADVHKLKESLASSVRVMQELCCSIDHLNSQMGDKFCNISELAELASLEREMLQESRGLLSSLAALQVQELSLRTHLLQLRRDVTVRKPLLTVGV